MKKEGTMGPRTIDLFCGGGGSSWGARAAGAEIVCGVDAWGLAARTFEANFAGARALTLRMQADTDASALGDVNDVDLILASPECTNHTCARGSRPRDEDSRLTANYLLNFARDLEPRWIVMENVVHMRRWDGYAPLVRELQRLKYNVAVEVLDAAEFGVPQNRRRLYILCDRERIPVRVPRPAGPQKTVQDDVLMLDGPWSSRPLRRRGRAKPTLERAKRAIKELGPGVPFLIVYYGSDGAGGWQPLDRPIRTLTTLDRFGLVTWNGRIPMLRMLQVPELRRAMGFGEGYVLPHGTRREQIRLLGNAVCPPVMESIVRSLTTATAVKAHVATSDGAVLPGVGPFASGEPSSVQLTVPGLVAGAGSR